MRWLGEKAAWRLLTVEDASMILLFAKVLLLAILFQDWRARSTRIRSSDLPARLRAEALRMSFVASASIGLLVLVGWFGLGALAGSVVIASRLPSGRRDLPVLRVFQRAVESYRAHLERHRDLLEKADERGELQAWWPSDPQVRAVRREGVKLLDEQGKSLVQASLVLMLGGVVLRLALSPELWIGSEAREPILAEGLRHLVLQLFMAPFLLGLIQMYVMATVTLSIRMNSPRQGSSVRHSI